MLIYFSGSSPETISLITVGSVLFVAFVICEIYTKRDPILPPRLFHVTLLPSIFCISILTLSYRHARRQFCCLPACSTQWDSLAVSNISNSLTTLRLPSLSHTSGVLPPLVLSNSRFFSYRCRRQVSPQQHHNIPFAYH
jgi:hypothetical protein